MSSWGKKIILPALILVSAIFLLSANLILAEISQIIIIWPKPEPDVARPVLQLNTFSFITLPPAPTTSVTLNPSKDCPAESIKPDGSPCKCWDSEWEVPACPRPGGPQSPCPTPMTDFPFPAKTTPGNPDNPYGYDIYCIEMYPKTKPPVIPPGCKAACIGKPVVYLYPTKPTYVSVKVEAPGSIIASVPLYPDSGWKDVLAHPDGTLFYKGKKYSELFYETSVTEKIVTPKEGIIIPSEKLEQTLRPAIARLGLIQKEQDEFLEYWIPVLQNLHSPYVLFSVLPAPIKESVDRLIISPQPDTRIEFIAYFKPLAKPISIRSLQLPQTPPKRIGFTEVEWGGTIGY